MSWTLNSWVVLLERIKPSVRQCLDDGIGNWGDWTLVLMLCKRMRVDKGKMIWWLKSLNQLNTDNKLQKSPRWIGSIEYFATNSLTGQLREDYWWWLQSHQSFGSLQESADSSQTCSIALESAHFRSPLKSMHCSCTLWCFKCSPTETRTNSRPRNDVT